MRAHRSHLGAYAAALWLDCSRGGPGPVVSTLNGLRRHRRWPAFEDLPVPYNVPPFATDEIKAMELDQTLARAPRGRP